MTTRGLPPGKVKKLEAAVRSSLAEAAAPGVVVGVRTRKGTWTTSYGEANPENGLVSFAAIWRDSFGWFTRDLFTPSDPKIAEAINAGLAALIWVVVGSLLSKLIVKLAPEGSSKKADA